MQHTQELLFIQRFTRPKDITYNNGIWKISQRDFSEREINMEKAIEQMMKGWISIRKEPIPFNERSFYGSSDHRIKNVDVSSIYGDNTFNIVIALPNELRKSLPGITVYSPDSGSINLSQLQKSDNPYWEEDHYKRISLYESQIKSIREYIAVYSGKTRAIEPLTELHYGAEIKSIMELLHNQEDSEGKPKGFRK